MFVVVSDDPEGRELELHGDDVEIKTSLQNRTLPSWLHVTIPLLTMEHMECGEPFCQEGIHLFTI